MTTEEIKQMWATQLARMNNKEVIQMWDMFMGWQTVDPLILEIMATEIFKRNIDLTNQ